MHAEPHARTSSHYQIVYPTPLFSKNRLKRKDFQELARLPWAQEAECAEYQGRSLQFSGKQVMRAVSEMPQSEKETQCASVVSQLATIRQECVGRERYFYERNPGCHV